ncbi:hypothetical protein [Bradyrhizobium nanningense]|nr:hypothetical protein [Bradyrhizobium nanningense]
MVAREKLIKHALDVDAFDMSLDEFGPNEWRHISHRAVTGRIKSPERVVA